MLLTPGDKLRIYLGNPNFLIGLAFSVIGLLIMVNFLSTVDFDSLWFITKQTTYVQGNITSASPTDYGDDEENSRVWEIDYSFSISEKQHKGHSYSSTQNVRPGTAVQIEYVSGRPELSRISGTSNAPFPLWALIPITASAISGFLGIRKSVFYCRQATAIAEDVFVTPAFWAQMKTNISDSDDEKTYNVHYTYRFNGLEYQHVHEASAAELEKLNKQENVALQKSVPANAMLVIALPSLVQDRLPPPCLSA